ncbi:MarR family winged helix-turn-helix transcriptional regulator [Agromyces larvae]|uniref:MarR family transcriptional regulator n=1 Tax=Agromyces larvae TaxID=2929802 RepID=A0ABY4C267_9MICO|nr:MarR family transcriptional regulator [Agromyces larvae]UOE44068.1 MarR family transcriptional regulator [Agromyces larvae]
MEPDAGRTAADLRLAVGRLVRRARRETATLPPSQMAVLGRLDRDGPQTVAALAAAERVSHQSMTRLVGGLIDDGLATPLSPPPGADRRRKPLGLTEAGSAALREQRSVRSSHLARAIEARLSPAEHRALAAAIPLLERLAEE